MFLLIIIQENAESELRAHSSSVRGNKILDKAPEESMPKTGKLQPFVKEEALVGIYNVCIVFSFYLHKFNYQLNYLYITSDPSTGSFSLHS